LDSFYGKFIRNFSEICAPLVACLRKGKFKWNFVAHMGFELLKKVIERPILALRNFHEVFQVDFDASDMAIGVVMRQDERPIAFFSEKLNEAKKTYSVYDQ
jgi:hypothetical protein